tara:strand:- start:1283 stop:3070 length:1788 start_codon:yes stop_codon:yes gene_type:complete
MDYMIQIDEGRMKDIFTADEEGKSAKEIAKALKLPLGTVKKILGEQEEIKEFTDSQLDVLARQYQALAGKTISIDQANKLRKIFKGVPDRSLDALRRKKIPFLSGLALSRMVQKGMPVKEDTEEPKDTQNKSLKIKLDKEKDQDALEKQLVVAQGQINILKQKLENEKNKAVKPEPNKETGEVPLTVGIAHKLIKDKQEKEKEKEKKEDVKEAFAVQITKKDGGKLIHGKYKDKAAADKFVKWYKTGDMKDTKSIEVVKEMAKDDAYAIGMAQAKKSMNDEKPLEKKTITKGHEIAKKILAKEARYRVSGQMTYRGISGNDGFEMVINANSEQDAEDKAYKELDKARSKRKIGPGGGGSIEDVDIEEVEKTNDRLDPPSHFRVSHYDPSMKEGKAPFRLSYDDRYGKHAGFEDAKTLADLQNKAANLRKRGFVINKMGRNTSPVKEQRIRPKRMVESDPIQYGPDKVAKAMKIAVKSDGNYSGAVREIEKIGKGLSKVSTIARALKTANEDVHAGARIVYEQIKGLKNKAEKTGMPYGILKKVYDRGMAAWRGGHRPGTTQQQWAFARVNSFVTKSSGTWGGADKDLAKQVRGKN